MPIMLILHASCGSGHRRAAEAVAAAARQAPPPGTAIVVRDVLDLVPAWYGRLYRRSFIAMARHTPALWGALYRWTDADAGGDPRPGLVTAFDRACGARRFARALDALAPDLIVTTHFLPLELLRARQRDASRRPPVLCVVTDYRAHALWATPGADLYAVAGEETARDLVARGVPPGRVAVTGIPVDPGFAAIGAARDDRPDAPIRRLLILSGGAGVGATGTMVRALDAAFDDLEITVSAGDNQTLQASLQRELEGLRTPVRIIGMVGNIERLFAEADLVITKPGGLTTTEAAVAAVPLILIPGIPGQEEGNARHFTAHGAAHVAATPAELVAAITRLRESRGLRRQMIRALRTLARPDAAVEIACRALALAATPGDPAPDAVAPGAMAPDAVAYP